MLLAAKLALPVMIVAIAVPPALVSLLAWATHPGPEQERWPGRPQLNKVSGVPATPFITSDRIDQLQNGTFKPSSKDIWVATYPKTGTTWTQTIVNHINGFPSLERGQYPFTYCPWPEVSLGLPPLRYSIEEINDFKRWEGPVGGWRCLKSHWHYADHMADAGKRVIYVMRNVLDVATSFYHHSRRFHFVYLDMADVSFDEFFEMLKAGNVDNGDYFDHVASWWAVKDRPNLAKRLVCPLRGPARRPGRRDRADRRAYGGGADRRSGGPDRRAELVQAHEAVLWWRRRRDRPHEAAFDDERNLLSIERADGAVGDARNEM